MANHKDQWAFYKQARILNPMNLGEMDHDISNYKMLNLPEADEEFLIEWRRYCRVEENTTTVPERLAPFWLKRQGKFADHVALFLNIPVTSAEVERSFSLAG
eukprot:EG_transcript_26019